MAGEVPEGRAGEITKAKVSQEQGDVAQRNALRDIDP